MRIWQRGTVTAIAASMAIISLASPAAAGDHYWGHGGWGHGGGWHHHDDGDIFAAGIIGLTLGAVIGTTFSHPYDRYYGDHPYYYGDHPYYREHAYYYNPPPPPLRSYRHESSSRSYGPPPPWTPEWYDYCHARHDSFDERSGTFIGTDRRLHFCE